MEENALPQEPQTPAPENLEPETTTAPAPSPVRENQAQVTDCPNTCLFAYMLGGTILGVMYGDFCIPMLLRLYAQTQHKIIEADWLLVVSLTSVALLGGLGIATSVILGKRMAAVKGAFWRWFYYGVIGAGIGAAVGALLMWGMSLVLSKSPDDYFVVVFSTVAGGISGSLFGSILFATVGCQLYCADGPDSKKAIRNSTALGIVACVTSSIAMSVISALSTLPQDEQMPYRTIFLTLLFVFMAVATGSMLGAVMSKKYAKIGVGTGLLLGAVLGGILGFVFGQNALYGAGYGTALGALLGVLSGALVGAVIDGTVDGEAVFAAGCAESAAWVIFWPVFLASHFAGPSLFLSMALLAILFGFVGKTFGAQVVWGTGGKTGTLLGAALGMVLGLALGIWQVTLLEEPSFELECILFIVLIAVQCLTIGMTLGAGIGVTMDRRRQRSNVSELPTDSTL